MLVTVIVYHVQASDLSDGWLGDYSVLGAASWDSLASVVILEKLIDFISFEQGILLCGGSKTGKYR